MDEFYMVRVAGLKATSPRRGRTLSDDGLTPEQQIVAIHLEADPDAQATGGWRERASGTGGERDQRLGKGDLLEADRQWIDYFMDQIFPVLTIAIDPAHPFPLHSEQVSPFMR